MWNIKYDTMKQKQTHRHIEQTCQVEGGVREGVWDQKMQTIKYRMNKQQAQGTIQNLVINHNGKEYGKNTYKSESLFYIGGINTAL